MAVKKVKLKTHSGAKKRFKKTANGFKHRQSFARHKLTKKSTKRKRHLGGTKMVPASDLGRVMALLPHS